MAEGVPILALDSTPKDQTVQQARDAQRPLRLAGGNLIPAPDSTLEMDIHRTVQQARDLGPRAVLPQLEAVGRKMSLDARRRTSWEGRRAMNPSPTPSSLSRRAGIPDKPLGRGLPFFLEGKKFHPRRPTITSAGGVSLILALDSAPVYEPLGLLGGLGLFSIMILPQVHLRKPCYDFYFL